MLAMRSFARALPRTACRVAPRFAQRQIVVPKASILSRTSPYKAFSTSRVWREPAGNTDAELSARFEYERTMEQAETKNSTALPQELQDFLAESDWKVQDQPGTELAVFTRQFGKNENIRVEVTISDVTDPPEDALADDMAFDDEPDYGTDATSGGKRTINQSGVQGGRVDVVAEDSIAPSDRDVDADETSSFALTLNIVIDKGAIGATHIIAQAQDEQLEIEYVHYYPRGDLVDPKTTEAAKEAQNLYGGPAYQHLDIELQQMYEDYLKERGINEQLFYNLSRYVEYKEQREYVQWLDNMKKFVDA